MKCVALVGIFQMKEVSSVQSWHRKYNVIIKLVPPNHNVYVRLRSVVTEKLKTTALNKVIQII